MSSSEYTPPSSPVCHPAESSASSHLQTSTSSFDQSTSCSTSPESPPLKRRHCTPKTISRSTLSRRINFSDSNSSFEETIQVSKTHSNKICLQSEPCNAFATESILGTSTSSSSSSSSDELDGNLSESDTSTDSECSGSDSHSVDSEPGHECCNSSESDSDSESELLLYDGATISTNQAILNVLKVFIAQRKTKACLNADVKLTKTLLPQPNTFPTSAKNLLKKLEQQAPFQKEIPHFFCSACKSRKTSEVEECGCGQNGTTVFYEFSVESQIRYMFEHRDLAYAIDSYHSQRVPKVGFISDIQDGSEYRRIRSTLESKYDLVLLLNTDGVKLAKSSKNELWGLLSVICEVAPQRRLSFMIVSGIFVAHQKPDMNLFLKPFVKSMQLITSNNGISWTHPVSKAVHQSIIVCPILCADAPAKAMVLKVKTFSHRYGCNVCEQKAVKVKIAVDEAASGGEEEQTQQNKRKKKTKQKKKRQASLRRFVYQEYPAALRNGARMNLQGNLAEERGKSRKGVVGEAEVCGLPHFDRAKSVCAEYMHTVMLGAVRYFISIWTTDKGPWNIGKHLKDIDRFLKSIRVPDFLKRLPRGLSDLPYLKASELRAFLLFYSLPALQDYLPAKYFQHWLLFVAAIFILLQESISDQDINASEVLLRCFVRDISSLYHNKYYTYNVHNLLHLPLLVRRWGPLWATSAFDFESFNGYITSHVHGTKHLDKEFLNNIKIIQSVVVFERLIVNATVARPNNTSVNETKVCGNPLVKYVLNNFQLLAIQHQNVFNYEIFERVVFNKVIYTSRNYDSDKRRSNSIVQFQTAGFLKYGEIIHFIKNSDSGKVSCLINVFKINHVDLFFHEVSLYRIKHILPVEESGELLLLPLCFLVTKVIKAGKYLCLRPNSYEVNM